MKLARLSPAILTLSALLATGCSPNPTTTINPHPTPATCLAAPSDGFAYSLTGYTVFMFTVNSCNGTLVSTTPISVPTGYAEPQINSEQMVADPLGRFAYVANLVSNASDLSTISSFTINPTTGVLTPTSPATVPTGWFPQAIAIDPKGRFVYTANSDDATVSMFTINQTSGVLTPTSPATVSTALPSQLLSDPSFITVDPTGQFVYVTDSLSNGAAVFMYTINQTTGLLTPTSPATVQTGGLPFGVKVSPNGAFAYVADNLAGNSTSAGVWEYTVNHTTGVLTPTTSVGIPAGANPTDVAIDPTSSFAYVVNRGDNTLSMYTIDPATANLTLNATTANPTGTIATAQQPFHADFGPNGKYLYVTNEEGPVSMYTVNRDGTLTSTGFTGIATGALSTAFTIKPAQ
ncbi:MAG: beta-propeller fold lactonase family protein [Acidobacteriaceae bacterium]